jgi:DNA modification methylase
VKCRNLHRSDESLGHPTQKPVAVVTPLVLYSSNPGDVVLDPYCGTGTSLVPAKMYGRQWIGMESDPKWHRVATDRLAGVLPLEAKPSPVLSKGNGGLFDE